MFLNNRVKSNPLKIFASIFFVLFSVLAFSQDWKPTYADAQVCSGEENKPIILVFAGSDWCAPCIKLDKNIWQSEVFKNYAAANYILYKADFPRKSANALSAKMAKQNAILADKFNVKGHFPLVVVLDNEENVLGSLGYEKLDPSEYLSLLNNIIK